MQTSSFLEALMYRFPGCSESLALTGAMSDGRSLCALEHPELAGLMSGFRAPKMCVLTNQVTTTFVVEPTRVKRTHPYARLDGPTCILGHAPSSRLVSEMNACMTSRVYLPETLKQVVWVDDLVHATGLAFSCWDGGRLWTMGDPMDPEAVTATTSAREILSTLMQSLKDAG